MEYDYIFRYLLWSVYYGSKSHFVQLFLGKKLPIQGRVHHFLFDINGKSIPWVIQPMVEMFLKTISLKEQFEFNFVRDGTFSKTFVQAGTFSQTNVRGYLWEANYDLKNAFLKCLIIFDNRHFFSIVLMKRIYFRNVEPSISGSFSGIYNHIG